MTTWQRLGVIGVVTAILVGGAVWIWPNSGRPAPPFPEIGFVRQGTEAPHTVLRRRVDPRAQIDDPASAVSDSTTSTWQGSLTFDDARIDDFDGGGRYRRRLAATNQPIGVEVTASDWTVWHIDADGDETIDLSIYRRPVPAEDALLPANDPTIFITEQYEELVVSRTGSGDVMATLYTDGGLHAAVCESGLFPDPGPLSPDDAEALAENQSRTIWCTRPQQRPERLEDPLPEAGEGEVSGGGDGGS